MTLPLINPALSPGSEDKDIIAAVASPSTYELALLHVDYNLHPLTVHNFEHYLDSEGSDELFHIR